MATVAGVKPHPIYLAGSWVDSPDILEIDNPARPGELAGSTYLATEAQYERAVEAAVKAFEVTRVMPIRPPLPVAPAVADDQSLQVDAAVPVAVKLDAPPHVP